MSLTIELEKELKIYSLMKDLKVTQVLLTERVTTLTSSSKSGARKRSSGEPVQRAPQQWSVALWPLCITNMLIHYPTVAVKYLFTAYKSKTFLSATFL